MSSGYAYPQHDPRDSHDARNSNRRARSRSRSPGRKARRGGARGYNIRIPNPDPESYRGGAGKSYRPVYDSPPRRVSPIQASFDRYSPEPQSRTARSVYKKGDIVVAKVDQQKQHNVGLEVHRGQSIRILSFVSGNIYRCENLATNATGQLDRKVFEDLPPPVPPSAIPEVEAKTIEQSIDHVPRKEIEHASRQEIEHASRQEIDTDAAQALQNVLFKLFEASVDTAYIRLQRDQAEEVFEARTATFNKTKEHHEKFPPVKETQTRQKLEAQKKLAALDEKHKQKTEAVKGLIVDALQSVKRSPDPVRFNDTQKENEKLKDLVKRQESLSRTFLEDMKTLENDMVEVKKSADMVKEHQDQALLQRVDELEDQYHGLGPQVQILVENEKLLRDNLKKVEDMIVDQGNISNCLTSLHNRIISVEQDISNRVPLLENRIIIVEQGDIPNRVVSLENTTSIHSDKIVAHQEGILELDNKFIENSKTTTDRLDRIEGQVMALGITDTSAKLEQRIKVLESSHSPPSLDQRVQALERAAMSSQSLGIIDSAKLDQRIKTLEAISHSGCTNADIETRLKNLEARPELQQKAADVNVAVQETIQAIESRVVTHLGQSNKAVAEVKQLVAAVEHGLGNLRSRVDNIYTSDLAKAMLDQVQLVYPSLKTIHETVAYLNSQIGQISTELRGRPDFQMLDNTLADIRQKVDSLQRAPLLSGSDNQDTAKAIHDIKDVRATNKMLGDFMTQYDMDYSFIREEIGDLKSRFVEDRKLIEELQSAGKSSSTRADAEAMDDAAKRVETISERLESLEAEINERDNFIKDKLEIPLKQIAMVSTEFKSLESKFLELKGRVNDLNNLTEKLDRRPGQTFPIKGASLTARPDKKRPASQNGQGPSKRRNISVETDQHTMYIPANKEDAWGDTIEDSEGE